MTNELKNPQYYVNREVSWLKFNDRVLEEARDLQNPLLERAKFLAITQSNLDEWYMVRVASLRQQVKLGHTKLDAAGMTPLEQLTQISALAGQQVKNQYQTLARSILPAMERAGYTLVKPEALAPDQIAFAQRFFEKELLPVLTPMAIDGTRPFPFLANDTLNIAVRLKQQNDNNDDKKFAVLQVPNTSGRVIKLPQAGQSILVEDIIQHFIASLFPGFIVKETAVFHVLRDMELDVADDEDTPNILQEVQTKLQERERGQVIRVMFSSRASKHLRKQILNPLSIDESRVYDVNGPIDLSFIKSWLKLIDEPELEYKPFQAYENPGLDAEHTFENLHVHDYLLHHPYDTFKSVVDFIRQASLDTQVLAIKMTLYRVSGNSPIIKALGYAAEQGKQVTVLVEIKARFDEENNVHWARELEKRGVHVIYGLRGLKTHAKAALVVRREDDTIRRYVHLGTGNYNDVTANFYTDMGILTSDSEIGADVAAIFNILTGYSDLEYFHQLHMSPDGIREYIYRKIDDEIKNAQAGNSAEIFMKFNSLSDERMIRHLYRASQAGVKIRLIIRGINMLKVGIPGISENIEVHSIVGRFLEHSRIYGFHNNGNPQIYLSSADLMTRNLDRRVELLFPIKQATLRDEALNIFNTMWEDNVKTRVAQTDGTYAKRDRRGVATVNAQQAFIQQAEVQVERVHHEQKQKIIPKFEPLNNPFTQ